MDRGRRRTSHRPRRIDRTVKPCRTAVYSVHCNAPVEITSVAYIRLYVRRNREYFVFYENTNLRFTLMITVRILAFAVLLRYTIFLTDNFLMTIITKHKSIE